MGPIEQLPQDLGVAEVEIESPAIGGRGVARHAGLVWLVEGALPGDRVEAAVVRAHPRWVDARAVRVVRQSPGRRSAPCPIQQRCGGCSWMTLDDEAQRGWKRTLLVDALERVGGIDAPQVEPTIASPDPLGYRNKIELTFGAGALGYHPPGNATEIVDVESCAVAQETCNRVVAIAREIFIDGSARPRVGLRMIVRSSRSTGQALVAFRGPPGPVPGLAEFAKLVRERVPEVVSVVRIEAREDRRGGARTVALSGASYLEESIAGIAFRLPAAAFCQVNPAVAERMAGIVAELADATAGTRVLELYGGIGILSLCLARRGASALVCDADDEALESGRRAARDAGELGVRYERGDVGRVLAESGRQRLGSPNVILADPPRAGLGRAVAASIAALGARRIVLVSCDPATLARDVREIVGRGYRLVKAVPLEMFPQTPHVESVALLEKN